MFCNFHLYKILYFILLHFKRKYIWRLKCKRSNKAAVICYNSTISNSNTAHNGYIVTNPCVISNYYVTFCGWMPFTVKFVKHILMYITKRERFILLMYLFFSKSSTRYYLCIARVKPSLDYFVKILR